MQTMQKFTYILCHFLHILRIICRCRIIAFGVVSHRFSVLLCHCFYLKKNTCDCERDYLTINLCCSMLNVIDKTVQTCQFWQEIWHHRVSILKSMVFFWHSFRDNSHHYVKVWKKNNMCCCWLQKSRTYILMTTSNWHCWLSEWLNRWI